MQWALGLKKKRSRGGIVCSSRFVGVWSSSIIDTFISASWWWAGLTLASSMIRSFLFFHLMTRAASGFYLVFWRNNRWSHVAHHCADKACDGVPPCGRTMKTRPSADVWGWDACFCFGFSPCVTFNQKPDVWVLCCTIIIQSALLGELDRWICCVYAGIV